MTIAAIGDVHLGALDRHIPDAYKKVIRTISRILANCESKGIHEVVFLGDIGDSVHIPDHMFLAFCDMLKKHDMYYHILVGNHDRASVDSHSLNILSWMGRNELLPVRVYNEPEIVKIEEDRYFMCPSPYVEDVPKKCRYGFGHFGFSGALSDTGTALASKNTPKGRWVLGDYHTPQNGKTYIYAGSVTQTKFYEEPDKGYIEIDEQPKFVSWTPSILLGRKTLTSLDELDRLDPDIHYVVTLSGGLTSPANWASQYPNVVRLITEKPVSKKASALLKNIQTSDISAGLDAWLANKGLKDKDISLARRLIGLQ